MFMKIYHKKIVLFLFFMNVVGHTNSILAASIFQTKAKQAILIDGLTGAVLYKKNPDELMVPSSMTKIMTIYMLFERLKEGRLKLEDTFYVSEKAWRKGGSKMFVELGSQIRVRDLIPGILVQSGNDACIVVSEGLAGAESAFVESMNETAHELGAKTTQFLNSNGWPDEGHLCSARDLAIIALKTIENFPKLYKMFYPQKEFVYNKIKQFSLNPLLYAGVGGDGLKTGHTDAGGYGLVGSAENPKGRRLIMVLNGLPSNKSRKNESIKLIQYGFRAFDTITIGLKGQVIGEGQVWLGEKPTARLAVPKDVHVSIESHEKEKLKVEIVSEGPIQAPFKAGDEVAKLVISGSTVQKSFSAPLVAAEDMGRASIFGRLKAAIIYLLLGHNPKLQKKETARGTR